MIIYSLILVFAMLAAFWSGFYIGYFKKEDKKPDIPIVPQVKEYIENFEMPTKKKREPEREPLGFYE